MGFIFLILIALISIGAVLLFKRHIGVKLKSPALRMILTGLIFIASVILCIGGSAALFFSWMYPTTNKTINDAYSFSQRPYGFATTPTNGYFLTFYRIRPFRFDEEIGKINLECLGDENIEADIINGHNNYNRLILKVNNRVRLDTMLYFNKQFNFKRIAYTY
jgi:hypothetical protein